MKKFILILMLVAALAVPALAQFDAGFLDHQPANTTGTWSGAGWYCIDRHPWPGHDNIVAGPFADYPNCAAY